MKIKLSFKNLQQISEADQIYRRHIDNLEQYFFYLSEFELPDAYEQFYYLLREFFYTALQQYTYLQKKMNYKTLYKQRHQYFSYDTHYHLDCSGKFNSERILKGPIPYN